MQLLQENIAKNLIFSVTLDFSRNTFEEGGITTSDT